MKKSTFTATIHDKKVFAFDSPERWKEFIEKLDGEKVFVTVGKWYTKMSDKQRKYYFGVVVLEIVGFTGHTKEEVHDWLKAKCNSVKEKIGEITVTRIKSTTELSTVEFEEYAQRCRDWAFNHLNIVVALPNECDEEFRYHPNLK